MDDGPSDVVLPEGDIQDEEEEVDAEEDEEEEEEEEQEALGDDLAADQVEYGELSSSLLSLSLWTYV